MKNTPELTQEIEKLPELELKKIIDETGSYIFSSISEDKEKMKEYLDKFEDIYYLSVSTRDIENYKKYPVIYEILKRYKHTAEIHPLELMFFKFKELTEEQRQQAIENIRKLYPDLDIEISDSTYQLTVGYDWWTAWRTNSHDMNEIKKIYPVKTLV